MIFRFAVCYNVPVRGVIFMASTNLNVRVDADVKKSAETVLDELGMNMSTAVNTFLRAVIRAEGIPFKVSLKKPEEDNEI